MTPSPFIHEESWYYRPIVHRQGRLSGSIIHHVDIPGEDPGEEDSGDRRIFLQKVLTTVSGQVLFTTLLIALFLLKEAAKAFLRENEHIYSAFNTTWWLIFNFLTFKTEFRPTITAKYTMAIVSTVSISYVVAALCCFFKTNSIILAAGITTGILFFILVMCPPPKIHLHFIKWWIFELVASVAVIIAGMIVGYLYLKGSLTNPEYVIPSILLLYLLDDHFKVLGISWFENTETTRDTRLFLSLSIYWKLMCIFLCLLFLIFEPEILNPTCPLLIE